MRKIFVLILIFLTTSVFAKDYRSAEQLSRDIPTISIPKIQQKSSINFKVGQSISDTYITTYPLLLSYSNYFSKHLGFIIEGSYSLTRDSDLKNSIDDVIEKGFEKVILPEYSYNLAHAMIGLLFKPIYGKITFFSEKIIHFDTFITVGAGGTYNIYYKAKELENNERELNKTNLFTGSVFLSIGQNYFLTNTFALNFEILDNITIGEIKNEFINQNFYLRLGMQYLF